MASIRERNGKFNVIYNYKDDSGKRRQKWETYDTKAVGKPVKRNKKNEYVSASTVREIHKLLRNCFEQAIKWEMIEKIRVPMQRCRNINHRNGKSGQQKH